MRNLITLVALMIVAFSTAAFAQAKEIGHIDDLVGSTFTCGGVLGGISFKIIYTFFPNNRYTLSYYFPAKGNTINVPGLSDYFYDGKVLKVENYGAGAIVDVVYKTTYLSKKNKMILTRDGAQQICNET